MRSLSVLAMLLAACGSASTSDELVGRWAGQSTVSDFAFAQGRGVRLDEIFVVSADGTMRGDFSAIDLPTACVVTYDLAGTWKVATGSSIDADWTSITVQVRGCADPTQNVAAGPVDAAELALFSAELDGAWAVSGDRLSITNGNDALSYTRATDPVVARWRGRSEVDDLVFAPGRGVELDEIFWVNVDGTLVGYFTGTDAPSQCAVDYRLDGTWRATGATIDVEWAHVLVRVTGCTDPGKRSPFFEEADDERALWNEELDGTWTTSGNELSIRNAAGGSLSYEKAL